MKTGSIDDCRALRTLVWSGAFIASLLAPAWGAKVVESGHGFSFSDGFRANLASTRENIQDNWGSTLLSPDTSLTVDDLDRLQAAAADPDPSTARDAKVLIAALAGDPNFVFGKQFYLQELVGGQAQLNALAEKAQQLRASRDRRFADARRALLRMAPEASRDLDVAIREWGRAPDPGGVPVSLLDPAVEHPVLRMNALRYPDEAARQELARNNEALVQWGASKRKTKIVMHSMSIADVWLKQITAIEQYEARAIILALEERRDPGLRIVFVTSEKIKQYILDHVIDGLPDGPEILKRVKFVSLKAPSVQADKILSKKLLLDENEETLAEIREAVDEFDRDAMREQGVHSPAALEPFIGTQDEKDVANRLGIPLFAADGSLQHWGTKSGSREIFKALGLPVLPGAENIYSVPQLEKELAESWAQRPDIGKMVLKVNTGVSGKGIWILKFPRWSKSPEKRMAAIKKMVAEQTKDKDGLSFHELLASEGVVVEQFRKHKAPSGQGKVLPDGSIEVTSYHDQRQNKDGYQGAIYPATAEFVPDIDATVRKIGGLLSSLGFRGRFGVDFLAVEDQFGRTQLVPNEINLRTLGTTHPFEAGRILTGAEMKDGRAVRADGTPVVYYSSDHTILDGLRGVDIPALLDFLRPHGILFDSKGVGARFHLLDAIVSRGNAAYTIIARSRAEAGQLEARLKKLLAEYERKHLESTQHH